MTKGTRIDEQAFEAFMKSYWRHGPTRLGVLKNLAAYEAAKQPRPNADAVVEKHRVRQEIYDAIYRTYNGEIRNIDEVADSVLDYVKPYLRTQAAEAKEG